jgi:hypothetical protein
MNTDFDTLKKEVFELLGKNDLHDLEDFEAVLIRLQFNIAQEWHDLGYDDIATKSLEELKIHILTAQHKQPKRPINIGQIFSLFKL